MQLGIGTCLLTSGRAVEFREWFSATYLLVAIITWLGHIWNSLTILSEGDVCLCSTEPPPIHQESSTVGFQAVHPPGFGRAASKAGGMSKKMSVPFGRDFLLVS